MSETGIADLVRQYASDKYVKPARAAGKRSVEINAGEVHRGMGLHARVPLVVTAIEALKFREANKLRLIRKDGPGQSTTTTFVFELL